MSAQLMELDTRVELTEDQEFKKLIPPLSEEEYRLLEKNIINDGCLSPIVVWNGVIIDGHNRYNICQKGVPAIPFEIKEINFPDRDAAKIWIIRNQFGRRNLYPYQRVELALILKEVFAKQAKENQRAGGGSVRLKSAEPCNVRDELSEIAGVGHDTFSKGEKISDEATEEDKERLRSGELTIHAVYTKLKKKEATEGELPSNEGAIRRWTKTIFDNANKLAKIEDNIPPLCQNQLRSSLEILIGIVGDVKDTEVCA